MLKRKWHLLVLVLIFLSVLGFRLFFVFQVDGFTGDGAYANLRQVEHVTENYQTIEYDGLGYGGRELLTAPLFFYFLSFVDLFSNDTFVFKILPELLFSLLVVVVYFITYEMTKDKLSSLFAALISGFVPLVIENTLNGISVYSLFFLLFMLLFYFLIKVMMGDSRYVDWFVFLSFLLPLIHPGAIIFVLSLIFYVVLMTSEGFPVKTITKELIFFTGFLVLLVEFIIFKEAFIEHGLSLVQYNLPSRVIENYFVDFSLFSLLYSLGVVSFILGIVGVFVGFFRNKNKTVFLFIGMVLSVLLMLLLKLIDFNTGMLFLGVVFPILAGFSLRHIYKYLSKTKLKWSKVSFSLILLVLVFFFGFLPSYDAAENVVREGVTKEEIDGLIGLRDLPVGSVLGDIEEGNMISYYAGKKSVLDSNFLLIENADLIVRDAKLIFLGPSNKATEDRILQYEVGYVYFSYRTKERYKVQEFLYFEGGCAEVLDENERYQIFRIKC